MFKILSIYLNARKETFLTSFLINGSLSQELKAEFVSLCNSLPYKEVQQLYESLLVYHQDFPKGIQLVTRCPRKNETVNAFQTLLQIASEEKDPQKALKLFVMASTFLDSLPNEQKPNAIDRFLDTILKTSLFDPTQAQTTANFLTRIDNLNLHDVVFGFLKKLFDLEKNENTQSKKPELMTVFFPFIKQEEGLLAQYIEHLAKNRFFKPGGLDSHFKEIAEGLRHLTYEIEELPGVKPQLLGAWMAYCSAINNINQRDSDKGDLTLIKGYAVYCMLQAIIKDNHVITKSLYLEFEMTGKRQVSCKSKFLRPEHLFPSEKKIPKKDSDISSGEEEAPKLVPVRVLQDDSEKEEEEAIRIRITRRAPPSYDDDLYRSAIDIDD